MVNGEPAGVQPISSGASRNMHHMGQMEVIPFTICAMVKKWNEWWSFIPCHGNPYNGCIDPYEWGISPFPQPPISISWAT